MAMGPARRRNRIAAIASAIEVLESRRLLSALFVSTSGSDSAAGTLDAPFQSIQHAVEVAAPGDTINIRGGDYNLSREISIETERLTLQAYNNEQVRISAPYNNSGIEVAVRVGLDAHYTSLIGLDISGGYYYTLKTESSVDWGVANEHGPSHLRVSNSKLHDSGRDVVKLTPKTDYSIIEGTEIYNSGLRDGSNAEGIDAVQANYAILRDSYIHDTATNGIYYKGGSIGTLIERNRITRTAHSAILIGQSSDENWFDLSVNPNYYESIDSIVRNNVIWDIEGAGIGAWAALRPQVYNNTLVDVAQSMFSGLLVQGQEHWTPDSRIIPSTDVTMYNNIVVVNSSRPAFQVRSEGLTGYLKTYNNLYQQPGGAIFSNDMDGFWGNLAGWQARGLETGSFEADAMLDSGNFFDLTASSPAIDRGANHSFMGEDFDFDARRGGASVDIGAQEYASFPVLPPPVQTPPADPVLDNTRFTRRSGQFQVVVHVRPNQNDGKQLIGLAGSRADQREDMPVVVRFSRAGKIDVGNGDGYSAEQEVYYDANRWYRIRFKVDMDAGTYDVWLTPEGQERILLASGYRFRTEAGNPGSLNNLAKYTEVGSADLLNISSASLT